MPRLLTALLACALLGGCASDPEPAADPEPETRVRDEIPPTDAPPLSKPRPKLIPGDVVASEEAAEDEDEE